MLSVINRRLTKLSYKNCLSRLYSSNIFDKQKLLEDKSPIVDNDTKIITIIDNDTRIITIIIDMEYEDINCQYGQINENKDKSLPNNIVGC